LYVHRQSPSTKTVSTRQILLLSQGRILALGGTGGGPSASSGLVSSASFALTNAGALDPAFGNSGLLPDASERPPQEFVTARELPNGTIVLASEVLNCPSPSHCIVQDPGPTYRVQRYRPNGTLDSTYAEAGTHTVASHRGNAAILADGTVIGLGVTYDLNVAQTSRPMTFDAVAIDAAGRANPTLAARFLTQMVRCSPTGTADLGMIGFPWSGAPVVQWTRDDRIVFAYGSCMLRLNPDATPDQAFGSGGLSLVDNAGLAIAQVQILADGSVLTFSARDDRSSYRVVKRLPTGSPDPAFGADGVLTISLPFRLLGGGQNTRGFPAVDAKGRVLVAGQTSDPVTNVGISCLARLDAQMKLDTTFGPAGSGLVELGRSDQGWWFRPSTIAVDAEDRIFLGGGVGKGNSNNPYDWLYSEAVMRL
jgi:uncharacterized delta-60 repeat protein